jgi:MYXO-CTERM domain-containing protein
VTKSSTWLTVVRAAALAAALLAFAPSGFAQSNANGGGDRDRNTTARNDRDDDTNWGWLGLLGLAGLAGLIPKKRPAVVVHDRDDRGGRH